MRLPATTLSVSVRAALVAFGLGTAPFAVGDVALVEPDRLRVVRGESSEQGVAALAVADQRGGADDWTRYVELSPDARGFVGLLEFELPLERLGSALGDITVRTNARGPEWDEQPWRWHVRDHRAGRWHRIGDNRGVPDWLWTARELELPGDAADHVDALGRVQLRVSTRDRRDVLDLDAVTLALETPERAVGPVRPPSADGEIWRPAPGTSWQWQLTGEIDTSVDVDMYDIDLFDAPTTVIDELHADGRVVICYFSAGSREAWRPDADDFPEAVLGRALDGWPGERWLDVRALDALRPVMTARMDLAVRKGCDGVEPDNVDAFDNPSGFPLTGADQIAYNVALAGWAHERGLSIGLKNDLGQVEALEPHFDWALNEQCVQFEECEDLSPFVAAGKAVFGVEYRGEPASFCGRVNALDFDWLKKPLALGPAREACR